MNKSILYSLLLIIGTTWQSCSVEDDYDEIACEDPNGFLSTVIVELSSSTGTVSLTFIDLDGEGGDDPVIIGGTLGVNTTYTYSATFLNEIQSPVEDFTEEVQEESNEHFLSLTVSGFDADVAVTDVDFDGNPLGLTGTITTMDAGSGEIGVVLLHEPTKTSTGATGGYTDVDVSYPVTVE